MIYQSFAILRTSHGSPISDKDPIYGDEIRGFVHKFSFIKNKNNIEGITVPMVFDQKLGYRPELSDWEYIYNANYGFGGSPASYYLFILPEIKFTRKTLFDLCRTNGIFSRALSFTARLKMMADIMGPTFRSLPAFDLSTTQSIPYATRISMIYFHTEEYPSYRNKNWVMSKQDQAVAYANVYKINSNPEFLTQNFNSVIMTTDTMEDLIPNTEEGDISYIPETGKISTPFGVRETDEDGRVYILPDEE